jgi:PAS domain S-box-containing protein
MPQESDSFHRLLIETSTDIIYFLDKEDVFTYVSPRFEEITGHPSSEVIGRHSSDVFNMASMKISGENNIKDDNTLFSISMVFANGDEIPLEINYSTLLDESDRPMGRLGIARDIRPRLLAQDRLRESEAKYHGILDAIDDAYFEVNLRGRYTLTNKAFQRMMRYSEKELIGRSFKELVNADTATMLYNFSKDIYVYGQSSANSAINIGIFRRSDGTEGYAEGSVSMIKDQQGVITGYCGIIRDVTEKKKIEDALSANEEKYRTIIENIDDGYYEMNEAGEFTLVNDSFCRIVGYERDDLIWNSYKAFLDKGSAEALTEHFIQANRDSSKTSALEWKFIRKDGMVVTTEVSLSPISFKKNERRGYRGIIRDVTEKNSMLHALKENQDILSRRNEAIEKDLAIAQHILKRLMPHRAPRVDEVKIDFRYLPLEAVGGDYFSFTILSEGGFGVFIGDVSNHGVSAALFLTLVKATTDRICRGSALLPREFITNLNNELYDNMPLSFLTAIYGVFQKNSGGSVRFTYSSGGHPQPIVYRASTQTVETAYCRGTLIGMFDDLDFSETSVELNPGDRVFLYTDGIPETLNEQREIWSFEKMPELIMESTDPSLSSTLDNIIARINAFRGPMQLVDDIVILAFEA